MFLSGQYVDCEQQLPHVVVGPTGNFQTTTNFRMLLPHTISSPKHAGVGALPQVKAFLSGQYVDCEQQLPHVVVGPTGNFRTTTNFQMPFPHTIPSPKHSGAAVGTGVGAGVVGAGVGK